MNPTEYRNRLQHETSPYLLQHAHNPVDWLPWGKEALTLAREQNKPILLSIGYSACHWCHVMAHESFEDPATAEVMNRLFVNIKVDREERPDLDRIYQSAHQLLMGRGGGWPLTMFLTPEQVPFFGGTYFPPEERYGLPGFAHLLERVAGFYHERREQLAEQNASVLSALGQSSTTSSNVGKLTAAPIAEALKQLEASYDRQHHGFGGAPKFPHPTNLELLLRQGEPGSPPHAMAFNTLRAMAAGGLQDQLGGGFFRYAVDAEWNIPHFEKMLYDNGPLLGLYTDAWQVSGEEYFRGVAEAIGEWVLREMEQPDGGYYATLDADSEGEEGKFYVWEPEQAAALLNPEEYRAAAVYYGLDRPANFEGRWHLQARLALDEVATATGSNIDETLQRMRSTRDKLFAARATRTVPGRDDKILTAWNGLMIKAMASAGRRLGRNDFINSAERALNFIRQHMLRDGRLYASWKDGQARHAAYLDDYAFLLDGVLELLQARWCDEDIGLAITLAEAMLDYFEDEGNGGFFFTADDHEQLIHRPKPFADEAIPAGNGIAAQALLKLGHLTGNLNYIAAAEASIRAAWSSITDAPFAHASLLLALDALLNPPTTIVLRGTTNDLGAWQARLDTGYAPSTLIIAIPHDARDLPGLLAERPAEPQPVAYLCRSRVCQPAIRTLSRLQQQLERPHEILT